MDEVEVRERRTRELSDYLRVVRERGWIVILAVVVAVGATLAMSFLSTPLYRGTSTLVYQTNGLDRTLFGAQVFSDTNQPRNIETAAQLVKLPQVAEAVKAQLNSQRSAADLLELVTVTPSTGTNLLQIDAVSPYPEEAADVANAFAQQFMLARQDSDRAVVAAARELVKKQLDTLSPADAQSDYGLMLMENYQNLQILESMQTGGFAQVVTAFPPPTPFSPRTVLNTVVALVVGLILGIGLALLLDYLDKRIRDTKELEHVIGLPVLVSVPIVGGRWKGRTGKERSSTPVGFASNPVMLESFRTLRSSLQYFTIEKDIKTILVTSGLPREGKTTTTINLALSLALAGSRVIIMEADLRRPMIPQYLGVSNDFGLSTILATGASARDMLQAVDLQTLVPEEVGVRADRFSAFSIKNNLFCLASGPLPPNPAELLSSDPMGGLLQTLRTDESFDYVVIDTPPVLSVADALVLAPKVDAVLITTRMNWTTREEAQEVSSQLGRTGARVIGVVATGAKFKSQYYVKRGYYQYA